MGASRNFKVTNKDGGITADQMYKNRAKIQLNVRNDHRDVMETLERISGDPNAMVTVYKVTTGPGLKHGDWVYISRNQALKKLNGTNGQRRQGVKLVSAMVYAEDLVWSRKNLEFLYI